MSKILLTNGCCYTGGHDNIHDSQGNLNPPADYTWPNRLLLKNSLENYEVTNIAIGGNSNDKILRRTIEHIEKNKVDAVIVQWTAMHRKELYFQPLGEWGNLCNHYELEDPLDKALTTDSAFADKNMYAMHFDKNVEYDESVLNIVDKITRSASTDYFWQYSETDYIVQYFQKILVLQSYLESKNIPYVFTSMGSSSHLPLMVNKIGLTTDYEKILASQINLNKWTKRPLTYIAMYDLDETKHPTVKGHTMIAKETTKEFNRING